MLCCCFMMIHVSLRFVTCYCRYVFFYVYTADLGYLKSRTCICAAVLCANYKILLEKFKFLLKSFLFIFMSSLVPLTLDRILQSRQSPYFDRYQFQLFIHFIPRTRELSNNSNITFLHYCCEVESRFITDVQHEVYKPIWGYIRSISGINLCSNLHIRPTSSPCPYYSWSTLLIK